MDALAPGDPKLVSMIVNHLKNQGLFDQFRRDCLADVDTKPAYQNLRQRVDNFVSNHLASHTWSPHLNKNQLRNSLRQMVLQSGMLEVGVDRIISQVVDPKINHIFRPQVEKAVHEFLATVDQKEEPASMNVAQNSEKQEPATSGPSSCPSTSKANDALSILDTITSLNQEASASRITAENSLGKMCEKISKKISLTEFKSQAFDLGMEKDHATEETEKIALETTMEFGKLYPKSEGSINALTTLKDFDDKHEKAGPVVENLEDVNEKNDKIDKREKDVTKAEQLGLSKNERRGKRKDSESVRRGSGTLKQTAKENLKKEYFLEDSDFEGLSDITVSSVHTSDLSSFEEDDDEEEEGEVPDSDSTDEVEEQSSEEKDTNLETTKEEQKEVKAKPGRHPYVHKPFLYSKYYNDSDDEETVVQRRQSIAKEKAERLLRRQWNRERVEDKRKQLEIEKDQLSEEIQRNEENLQPLEKSINSTLSVETNSRKMMQPTSLISKVSKAALKEQKILEKKVALRRKRKGDLRTLSGEVALHHEDRKRKREQLEELKETQLRTELLFQNKEKAFASTLKDSKNAQAPDQPLRSVQILSELNGENNNHLKIDHESCRKQPRSNDLDMSGLEQSRVNKLDDFGLVEENLKDSSKHKGEMKQLKHGDGELMGSESSSWTCDIDINDDQKIGTTFDSVITNYHQVIQSSDSKTLLPSDSAELPILEHGQEIKSRDHTKIKEEKGKEKKYIAEGSWTKSREYTQENTKSYEKNKEKRNESECLRSKFKESVHDDVKSTEKCKEKRNDFENPCLKFKESINEDGKTREKKNESERGRTKSRENTLEDKGHEKSKDKKYMSERTRSLSEESLQDDMKGSEKGKEKRTESGNSRSKSREKMHDDTRSHEKLKENQNESGISRSKSRESVQEDVKNKDKRKNFENARSRSKEELQEDKREKRIEKRRESESSKSKERVDSSRSKTKESIELSRSKSKEDNEYKQKVVEKRHDSETARLKFKEHSEITRSKSREKLQGDVQYDEKVEKRRDSENVWLKSKDSVDGSRSKSKDKVQDTIQNEKGIEKKHSSENTGPKSRECSESSHLKVKEKMRDSAQGSMKGNDKRHDSKIKHFEKSHSKSKEDLQVNNAKKMEQRFDFGSNRSKSGERSEHSRSKSKEHSDSSRSKYKERVQENIQSNEKGMDKKHKYENTLSKSVEHSEISQLKSSEKGKESIKDCDKGKFKKSDFQNVQSKSKEFSESMQAKSKDKAQGGEKGSEKGNFETSQSCSKDKMPDLPCDEKLEEKDIKLLAALSKPKTDQEDEQSRDKSNKLKNVAEYVEEVEMTKSNEIQESHTVEYDQSGSKADLHTDIKNEELVEGKKDTVHFELKEWHLGENETNSTEKKSENAFSKSSEKFENDQSNNEGTDIENSQLHLEESRLDTKEIAHTYPGNMVQIENLIKSEDKLEERTETFESESSKAEPRENLNLGEKELETEQNETDGCKTSLLVKEQTETPAHEQLAKSNEINIHPDLEQQGSLPIPYVAASPDDPTTKDSSLFHPIAAKAQFVYYDPSSPATPTLDENFSYEAPSSVADSSIPSVEGPGKQEAHSSENVAEELCAKNQAEEMDIKCEPPKVELQELPVQQDIVPEINTSAIGELKDEDLTEESVTGAREQSSTKNERKPKRSYTPVENPPKRRHLNSEEKSAAVDELVETIPVQAQEEESPMQCQEKTTKVEDKARNLTSDVSSQNKPTTRAAKKVSSPEHLSVTEQEKHSLTSTKEKPTTDVKSGKSPAPVSVTRSRNQPSPVIKQGRKREASPERKRRQHKTEVPPKRTRR